MLRLIHHWDIQSFQNISNSELRPAFIGHALILSKSGDGWLYPLTPLFLFLFQAPSAWNFLKVALTAFVIERCIYLIAKNGLRRRRPMAILNGFTSRIIPSDEFSFPSGHTSAAFLMTTLLAIFYGISFYPIFLLYLWATGVAISRILLGVHFPTDTIVGAVMGISIAYVVCNWTMV